MPFDADPFDHLITHFGLHDDRHDPFVNLAPCETLFAIERFAGTRRRPSWALPSGAPIPTAERPATVFLSDHLSDQAARAIYAHEIAHVLLNHRGTLTLRDLDDWFNDRQEAEAWAGAAYLLIPPSLLIAGMGTAALASVTHTPPWLPPLHPWLRALRRTG